MPGITNEEYREYLTKLTESTSAIKRLRDELEAAQSTIRSLQGQLADSEARYREAVFNHQQTIRRAMEEQTTQAVQELSHEQQTTRLRRLETAKELKELRELMQLTTAVLYDVVSQTMGGAAFGKFMQDATVQRARNAYRRANAISVEAARKE